MDLIAEITIIDDSNTNSSAPSSSEAGGACALATSFPSMTYRGGHQCDRYCGSYRGRGGNHRRSSKPWKLVFDLNEYCETCKTRGHNVQNCSVQINYCKECGHERENCLKLRWVNEQRVSKRKENGNGNGNDVPYTPSFDHPQFG